MDNQIDKGLLSFELHGDVSEILSFWASVFSQASQKLQETGVEVKLILHPLRVGVFELKGEPKNLKVILDIRAHMIPQFILTLEKVIYCVV